MKAGNQLTHIICRGHRTAPYNKNVAVQNVNSLKVEPSHALYNFIYDMLYLNICVENLGQLIVLVFLFGPIYWNYKTFIQKGMERQS